jgi:hypothetical protein
MPSGRRLGEKRSSVSIRIASFAVVRECEANGQEALRQLEQRRRVVTGKLDRGYEDYVSGKISEELWTRKLQAWDAELQTVDSERSRLERPQPCVMATATRILELAKQAVFLYQTQDPTEQSRLLETVLFELHLRSRNSLSYLQFAIRPVFEVTKQEIGGEGGIRAKSRRGRARRAMP